MLMLMRMVMTMVIVMAMMIVRTLTVVMVSAMGHESLLGKVQWEIYMGNWVGYPIQGKHMTNRSRQGRTNMKTQQIQICLRGRN